MTNGLISLCIANYNKEKYIRECLDSIKKHENIKDLEIIFIDDCSTDNSLDIVRNRATENKEYNIIIKQNTINSWPWVTYNNAVQESHWEFITFMDSDDFYIASTLYDKRDKLQNDKELQILYWDGNIFENNILFQQLIHYNGTRMFNSYSYDPQKILNDILVKVPLLSLSTSLIRKDFFTKIGWFDPECFSNDRVLNIRIFKWLNTKNQFSIMNVPAFAYRIYSGNISKNYDKILMMLIQVIEKYTPNDLKHIWFSNIYFTHALWNLTTWNYKKAFSSMKKSYKFNKDYKKLVFFGISLLIPPRLLKVIPPDKLQKIKSTILWRFQ